MLKYILIIFSMMFTIGTVNAKTLTIKNAKPCYIDGTKSEEPARSDGYCDTICSYYIAYTENDASSNNCNIDIKSIYQQQSEMLTVPDNCIFKIRDFEKNDRCIITINDKAITSSNTICSISSNTISIELPYNQYCH